MVCIRVRVSISCIFNRLFFKMASTVENCIARLRKRKLRRRRQGSPCKSSRLTKSFKQVRLIFLFGLFPWLSFWTLGPSTASSTSGALLSRFAIPAVPARGSGISTTYEIGAVFSWGAGITFLTCFAYRPDGTRGPGRAVQTTFSLWSTGAIETGPSWDSGGSLALGDI